MILACTTSFFLGVIATMWTLNRIGKRLQRKAQERAAQEITRQVIAKAYQQHVQQN